MQDPYYRRGLPPWVWVLVTLAAVLLVFVIWWAAAAGSSRQTVVNTEPTTGPTTGPTTTPTQPQIQQPTQTQGPPVVIERQRPVTVYVQPRTPQPKVVIVPKNEQPPASAGSAQASDLPGAFSYQGKTWEPSTDATTDRSTLQDTGAEVNGNSVFARDGAEPPYDELYVETSPGSGVFVRYDPG